MIDKYKIAIETVNWLVGEMSAEDIEKYPEVANQLDSIRGRLNFIFRYQNRNKIDWEVPGHLVRCGETFDKNTLFGWA